MQTHSELEFGYHLEINITCCLGIVSSTRCVQGYALHGHVDLHTWHTHVGSTGTSGQYILPVPWFWDHHLLGTMILLSRIVALLILILGIC